MEKIPDDFFNIRITIPRVKTEFYYYKAVTLHLSSL